MNQMNKTELIETTAEGVHLSMYMPVESEPDKQEKNRIRLKNLVKEARARLAEEDFLPKELSRPASDSFFETAETLTGDLNRNGQPARGLAIFLGPSIEQVHHLPIRVEEGVHIGPHFHVRPLLPLFSQPNALYLLSLSQNKVQLWRGGEFGLEPVDVPQLPEGMAEALAFEDPERSLQFHTSTGQASSGKPGERAAVHHGHEADKEKKGAVLRYFREVNEAVMTGLSDEKAPLLVAAVDYLIPIYREANTYSHLFEEGIPGNPDRLNAKELHEKAWQTAEPHFNNAREGVMARFHEKSGTELISMDLEEIVPAAVNGRIDTLILPRDNEERQTGFLNRETNSVERCGDSGFHCVDLLNLAAVHTLQNSGKVYVFADEEMPEDMSLGAIFRYVIQPA